MVLGQFITKLVVHLGLIDLDNNDLQPVRNMAPLNLHCLDDMGLLCCSRSGIFSFAPAGPVVPRERRVFQTQRKVRERVGPMVNEASVQVKEQIVMV